MSHIRDWLNTCFTAGMKDKNIEILGEEENLSSADFYSNFKEKLEETSSFPMEYMFKFILPSGNDNVTKLKTIFKDADADFSSRESKNGKYTSFTIKVKAKDADEIVAYYKQVAEIEGVLTL